MTGPRTEVTDEALMIRFQRGDRAAFTQLVRRHQTGLYNFALRQIRVQAVAEDIVQEVAARILTRHMAFSSVDGITRSFRVERSTVLTQ